MLQDIQHHIELANGAIAWAKQHGKESFPYKDFSEHRRQLRRIHEALAEKCSAAAYGESQVGKSYLMNSLLSSPEQPFVIMNGGKEYSFIDEINPSGGNNAKTESTGIVTRFTLSQADGKMKDYVKIRNLSIVDIILLLSDAYYNDVKANSDSVLMNDEINRRLDKLNQQWSASKPIEDAVISADDIKDITDYMSEIIGSPAAAVIQSNFLRVVSSIIPKVPYDKWVDVFSLLWNGNDDISHLFGVLINEYKKLDFCPDAYIPFDAVRRDKGTLLKIEWLDTVCGVEIDSGNDELFTDVFSSDGRVLARDFNKGSLSALIAELTFYLPQELAKDREFLTKIDLLDFPGARSREKYKENEIHSVLPKILRRGKVAYLFNKYSRSLRISSVLFCHHNDQKAEATIGEAINSWIEENIGRNPEERAEMISHTNGIAPLFLVATKFNLDLEKTKTDKPGQLSDHWKRFDTVLPKIIKPNKWMDEWVSDRTSGKVSAFRNIYPLRDFYWSGKNSVFDGYSDGAKKSKETNIHHHADYPQYFDDLRESFLSNKFVRRHFSTPQQAWDDVATENNDGSKAIIRSLDAIAPELDNARRSKYMSQLLQMKKSMYNAMMAYYEPEDESKKNEKVKQVATDTNNDLILSVAKKQETFGRIIDSLMIPVDHIRDIAYDIVVCHTDRPIDFTAVEFVKAQAGIATADRRNVRVEKLCRIFSCEEEQLGDVLGEKGISVEDVISDDSEVLSTIGRVVAKHIEDHWTEYVNSRVKVLVDDMPHSDEVVFMLVSLFRKLHVRKAIAERIDNYCKNYDKDALPNVIADYVSLTLNNFVSSIGRSYISNEGMADIRQKALKCNITMDLQPTKQDLASSKPSLAEAFDALDKAADMSQVSLDTLKRLPLWDNFDKWRRLVTMGLVYASDVSNIDLAANEALKQLIADCEKLYKD